MAGLPSQSAGPLLAAARLLALDLGAVEEDQAGQLGRGSGEEDGPAEALAHDDGQEAAVVEMGVGDEEGIDVSGS